MLGYEPEDKLPKIALLGYGRAGKDTAGAFLGRFTPLRYVGSTSMVMCDYMAGVLGVTPEEAWKTRHAMRRRWYDECNEFRKDDPSRLAKLCLTKGDLVVGLRDKVELQACKAEQLFDLTVWVNNERVAEDPTVTFTREDCDVVVDNNTTLADFYKRLVVICKFGGIIVDPRAKTFDQPTLDENDQWQGTSGVSAGTPQLRDLSRHSVTTSNWRIV